jgi:hypothetical protein
MMCYGKRYDGTTDFTDFPGAAKPQPKKQNHRCTPIHTDSQKQPEKFAKPSQILDDSSTDSQSMRMTPTISQHNYGANFPME